jgi:hypothetical protein
VTRLHWRIAKIKSRCGGGRAVAAIVREIERCSNEQLRHMNESGEVERLAGRLSDRELDRLIEELKAMQERTKDLLAVWCE